jgi:ABC-2 type transport system permease protein
VRWEWFKLQRQRMPWVLLAVLVVFSQLAVWGGYMTYNALRASGGQVPLQAAFEGGRGGRGGGRFQLISCHALRADPAGVLPANAPPGAAERLLALCDAQAPRWEAQVQQAYTAFTLPGSLSRAFGVAHTVGLILIAVLAASAIGAEHGHGTLRSMLVRGTGRFPVLGGKFVLLAGVAAAALLVVAIVTAGSSATAAGLTEAPPGEMAPASWREAPFDAGRIWLSFIPFVAFTAMVTVLTRSTAAGMAVGLGYLFTEGLLAALLTALFAWFEPVNEYLLVRNINALAGSSFGPVSSGGDITRTHASVVLAVYTVVFAAVALERFRRRDVAGASGG